MATAALTQAGAELAGNKVLRNTGTSPTTWYLGLATSAVSATTTLATVSEVTTAGYARQACTFNAPSGSNPVTFALAADEVFGPFSADPPSIGYAFLTDASSGTVGTIYARWSGVAVDAGNGESLTVKAGTLTIYIATAEAS